MTGQWFSLGPPISSNNQTDRHDININNVESGVKHHNSTNQPSLCNYMSSLTTP